MSQGIPVLGIDFGTSNSKMAWFNPKTRQAEIVLNSEGEQQTPSVVYFGARETLVGKDALEKLEYSEEWERVIISVKRELVNVAPIALPDRIVRATDVVKEILSKLKRDAEEGHFHEEVKHAVITCPAKFDSLERERIHDAALDAGFREVELLDQNMVTTAFELPGFKVVRNFGVVRGIVVRSLGALGSMGAAFKQIAGGNITQYTKLCEQTRLDAYQLMIQHAQQMGANALVAVRYDATEVTSGVTEVLCYGTALQVVPEQR